MYIGYATLLLTRPYLCGGVRLAGAAPLHVLFLILITTVQCCKQVSQKSFFKSYIVKLLEIWVKMTFCYNKRFLKMAYMSLF